MFPLYLFYNVVQLARHLSARGLERTHENESSGVAVAKQGETLVGSLFKVAEADDVATVLYRIEYAVGARVGLQQSVHLQVLVHPQGV